ncbi:MULTISPECIES: hypothetical protein [Pseudomonas syringae group]|uniref:hypothetical protein n=1 Tax=Pseudomonas syringae group TaxID=136849 RepID=UPI000F00E018|nr:hypothetical protein [Pseudomonas syringae group genomosp. 3]
MHSLNKFELRYYLIDNSHQIDAFLRNKCETEILAIILEIAEVLGFNVEIVAEAVQEGGFREFWKLIKDHSTSITLILMLAQTLITAAPLILKSEKDELEKQLIRLQIQERQRNLESLQKEAKANSQSPKTIEKAISTLSKNLKIIKRKSNFYELLADSSKINKIGLSLSNNEVNSSTNEIIVIRANFKNFILNSNKLEAQETEATIEIVSPVLKEGKYRWKGIYNKQLISFHMLDMKFRDSVILDNVAFQHGTYITCVLRTSRELNEIGEVKITGFAVTTVIEKIDKSSTNITSQGKEYLQAKKFMEGQGKLFS